AFPELQEALEELPAIRLVREELVDARAEDARRHEESEEPEAAAPALAPLLHEVSGEVDSDDARDPEEEAVAVDVELRRHPGSNHPRSDGAAREKAHALERTPVAARTPAHELDEGGEDERGRERVEAQVGARDREQDRM